MGKTDAAMPALVRTGLHGDLPEEAATAMPPARSFRGSA